MARYGVAAKENRRQIARGSNRFSGEVYKMIFKKVWRVIRGHIDKEELRRQVLPYVAPSSETTRYRDHDKEERRETQRHINEANSTLFRLRTQQALRRREY